MGISRRAWSLKCWQSRLYAAMPRGSLGQPRGNPACHGGFRYRDLDRRQAGISGACAPGFALVACQRACPCQQGKCSLGRFSYRHGPAGVYRDRREGESVMKTLHAAFVATAISFMAVDANAHISAECRSTHQPKLQKLHEEFEKKKNYH